MLTDNKKAAKACKAKGVIPGLGDAVKESSQWGLRKNMYLLCVLSLIMAFLLEIFGRGSLFGAVEYLLTMPVMFLANMLVVMLTLIPSLFIKKRLPYIFVVWMVWLALGISNGIVLSYRAAPLSAIDFLVVKSMLGMATIYFTVWQLILIGIGIAAFVAALVLMIIKSPKCRVHCLSSLIAAAVTVAVFVALRLLAVPIVAGKYESGKLADAYREYGFAYCFSHSLISNGVDKPDDYEPDDPDEIIENVTVSEGDGNQIEIPLVTPNIVMVQLESFFDVSYIKDISFSADPIPNYRAIKDSGVSGLLRVPHLGGGTSNVEFEVLTGMSLDHFGFGEYPYTTVLKTRACESLAANLKAYGYSAHAMHNHVATFYDRNLAYASLGFDSFTPIELMTDTRRNPLGWAKDEVLVHEITSALDSTQGRDLVFAVSVQAHGKYPEEPVDGAGDEYKSPEDGGESEIEVLGIADEAVHSKFEYYVNQIHEMDAFVGELISVLTARGEPCIAVFYGDHLPSLPMNAHDLSTGDMFLSEYALWSNIPLGGIGEDGDVNTLDRDIETYRLSAYIQQLCGMSEGDITKLHQYELATGEDRDADLRTLEYAQLYDDGVIEYEPVDMRYGTRALTVDSCIRTGNTLTIKGSNFNEYSVVKLNGFKHKSVYVDSFTIRIDNVIFSVDKVEVIQPTVDGTVLACAFANVTDGW